MERPTACLHSAAPPASKREIHLNGRATMESFADRVVLITGAASGIGREFARVLAGEGARIAALDLRADSLEKLAADLKGKHVATAVADVTDLNAVRAATR